MKLTPFKDYLQVKYIEFINAEKKDNIPPNKIMSFDRWQDSLPAHMVIEMAQEWNEKQLLKLKINILRKSTKVLLSENEIEEYYETIWPFKDKNNA